MDVEQRIHLNTAVSALMELVNELYGFEPKEPVRPQAVSVLREALEALTIMLSPFSPHTAEEMWARLGHQDGLAAAAWPSFDEQVAKADEIVVPVQVNGKLRARLTFPADTPESEMRDRALADPAVKAFTDGKKVKTVVVAKGRRINVVVE